MGGCCSKCDKYLLGGQPDVKGGDTPKLARVSHSDSFAGVKGGDNGEVAKHPAPSANTPTQNGRSDDKPPVNGVAKDPPEKLDDKPKLVENGGPVEPTTTMEEKGDPATAVSKVESSSDTTVETTQSQASDKSATVVETTTMVSRENSEKTVVVNSTPDTIPNAEPMAVVAKEITSAMQQSVESSSIQNSKTSSVQSSETVQSSVSRTMESSTVQSTSSEAKLDTTSGQTTHLPESIPEDILSEIQNEVVEESTSRVQKTSVVKESVQTSSFSQSTTESAVMMSSVEETSNEQSSITETKSQQSSVSSVKEESHIKEEANAPESKLITSAESFIPSSSETACVQSSVETSASSVRSSVTESVSAKSSVLESSSTVESSTIESSSTVVQKSAVQSSESSNSYMQSSLDAKASIMGEMQPGNCEDKLGALLQEKMNSSIVQGEGDLGEVTAASTVVSESTFSSSSSSRQAVTKISVSGAEGAEPVVQVEESKQEEKSVAVSASKVVDGQLVESKEEAELERTEVVLAASQQGDKVTESSAVLKESAGISVQDGKVVSTHQDSSFTEHTDADSDKPVTSLNPAEAVLGEVLDNLPDHPVEVDEPPPVAVETTPAENATNALAVAAVAETDEETFPPPPSQDEFPPPPPEAELPPPVAELDSPSGDSKSSYAALVTPSGFMSPTRDETDASRRTFAKSLLENTDDEKRE